MKIRRRLAAIAAAVITIAAPTALAPASHAADLGTSFASCTLYDGTGAKTGAPGDTFSISMMGCGSAGAGLDTIITWDASVVTGSVASGTDITSDQVITFTIAAGAVNGAHPDAIAFSRTTNFFAVTVTGGADAAATSSDAPGPTPWFKAYQRAHKDEPCLAGWNPSYAQWANNNSGGWVCVQELYYSGGAWLTR